MRTAVLILLSQLGLAQTWSSLLDSSRAVDWTSVGFTIPSYTASCSTQPTLLTGSGNASANTTAIQNSLNSCDATHNIVSLPAGTYYVAGWTYGSQGKQVVRGAGPNATTIMLTAYASCGGIGHGACMIAGNWTYSGDSSVLPPSGSRQCRWTGGYAQGSTTITLSSCGGPPPVNQTLVLDQANDTSDTNGVYICDGSTSNCTYEGGRNADGRVIGTDLYSNQQVVYTTGVTPLGGGSYTVSISPGIYLTNIRSEQTPGAWWPGFVQNNGLENLTLDGTNIPSPSGGGLVGMFSCYQCWVKNTRLINGARNHVWLYQSMSDVIRDSYFYGSMSHAATSYTIESDTSSNFLVENNIFQQVTTPLTWNGGTVGAVVGYNFAIKNIFADGSWTWPMYASHSAGNVFNLFEGNNAYGISGDNASGPSDQTTVFRNFLTGFQPGTSNLTESVVLRALNRTYNIIGNVLGQASIQTQYQAYATSTTSVSGGTTTSIYDLGGGGTGDVCALNPGASTLCDPLTFSTMMRWGNYDVVTAGVKWDSTEASPVAVTYVNANFTSSYFSSLAHTLPSSLYYSSKPAWWPSGTAWPPIGPDVSSGNVGVCNGGTYAGTQATSAGQCAGGSLSSAWGNHATAIPAQVCYLSAMAGSIDGTGNALSFDASVCYPAGGIITISKPSSAAKGIAAGKSVN